MCPLLCGKENRSCCYTVILILFTFSLVHKQRKWMSCPEVQYKPQKNWPISLILLYYRSDYKETIHWLLEHCVIRSFVQMSSSHEGLIGNASLCIHGNCCNGHFNVFCWHWLTLHSFIPGLIMKCVCVCAFWPKNGLPISSIVLPAFLPHIMSL